jgi:hypothetical protein
MNDSQKHYYEQALSDLDIYKLLRREKKHPCHILHYLQMLTEKLGKAFAYGKPDLPLKSHTGFQRFVQSLSSKRNIWKALDYPRLEDFSKYLREVNLLATQIERLAPSECGAGPNPEYPWPPPPDQPIQPPANFDFPLWKQLSQNHRGQKFLRFVEKVMVIFPQWF